MELPEVTPRQEVLAQLKNAELSLASARRALTGEMDAMVANTYVNMATAALEKGQGILLAVMRESLTRVTDERE